MLRLLVCGMNPLARGTVTENSNTFAPLTLGQSVGVTCFLCARHAAKIGHAGRGMRDSSGFFSEAVSPRVYRPSDPPAKTSTYQDIRGDQHHVLASEVVHLQQYA